MVPTAFWILSAALGGGLAGHALRIPGGSLLGATIATALTVNLADLPHDFPPLVLFLLQGMLGAMLGQCVNRRFWREILGIWRPSLVVVSIFTAAAVPFCFCLVHFSRFDPLTAALAATPGRIQDVIVLAGATGRDGVTVMLLHMVRQLCILVATPIILARSRMPDGKNRAPGKKYAARPGSDALSFLILFGPAALGAYCGSFTNHPLGSLLGAFILVAASRMAWARAGEISFPVSVGVLAQCLAGLLLGIRITPDIGSFLVSRLTPFVFSIIYILGTGLAAAGILRRLYGWSKELSWMSAAPGRTTDMLAISQDLDMTGYDRLALATVHAVRQLYFTLFISILTALF